jgi:hypothetical protein
MSFIITKKAGITDLSQKKAGSSDLNQKKQESQT